ncbi:vacuolar morphogenesis protein 7 [Kluyveromyces marxianus DMKU3-1042]|uniref:Vacuolar morphogenesis protein 7 n=1 Tax=Kluyveromyces marxianus (strain DMKU3-1042 / BCC 29191 / NBRC 104275) TaxID=1003335 RepID=W0TAA9_KLUMD|nr:vacuolar morphogenesis protein 7 [Kluyveromyces marxianus DMKU3-1042]BAO39968.1 vacuolar morphogenesis protein 7 [Kluyveromyces marxianus DMKU3-1042]
MSRGVKCEVSINDVSIVEKKYALYHIALKVVWSMNDYSEYKCERRFSDFIQFKKQLEYECQAELPYDLPGRKLFWGRKGNSCDPDIIEERRLKLRQFLSDLLNDSFETKWRKSSVVSQFLNLPEGWYIKPSTYSRGDDKNIDTQNNIEEPFDTDEVNDPSKWLNVLRDCKSEFHNTGDDTRSIMRQRLVLSKLEKGLNFIEENELVSRMECERRKQLLNTFKNDLNSRIQITSALGDHQGNINDLMPFNQQRSFEEPKISKGRRLGETKETENLGKQQLLQLQKDKIKEQDQQLYQLHEIVHRQKNISLALNQELEAQNELLDLFQDEATTSANKLRTANRNAVRFNQGQR